MRAIFNNSGQVCAAGSRLYAHKAVFDKLQAPAAFFNLDTMMTEDAYIQERFKAAADKERVRQNRPPGASRST